jgi:hypothetical protein
MCFDFLSIFRKTLLKIKRVLIFYRFSENAIENKML